MILMNPVDALSEREVRLRQIGLKMQRRFSPRTRCVSPFFRGLVQMEYRRAQGRQPGVRKGENWVQRDRLGVAFPRGLVILQETIGIFRDLICLQVKHVCFRAVRRLGGYPNFSSVVRFARRTSAISPANSPCSPSESDERAIVAIRPQVAISCRADQLQR